METCELDAAVWTAVVGDLLASGYFRIDVGAVSLCDHAARLTILVHRTDGRTLFVTDRCWGCQWFTGDHDHPGFAACLSLLRNATLELGASMPQLEPKPP